jgi:glycosyltransferase involved in cell wall biosynthesis
LKVKDVLRDGVVVRSGYLRSTPVVSIVTPTYRRNAEGLLGRCLKSATAQTFLDFEHIVIDDGSSDGSEQTILAAADRDPRLVYVRHERNSGLPAVRTNEGIAHARGEYIAFLFDDNIYAPDFLATAVEEARRSGADVVFTNVHMLTKEGKPFPLGGWPLTLELLRNLNTIPNGGVLVRRSFFDKYGLYDPHVLMRRVCDWELWLRALRLGATFSFLPITSATEYGLVSENSIGNTVAWDIKIVYGYMLDEREFKERAKRFAPSAIGNVDVLEASSIERWVCSQAEWRQVMETVYRPFLDRHPDITFDPDYPSNRSSASGIADDDGFAAPWSFGRPRKRFLVVSNAMNGYAAAWLAALRRIEGAMVLNCPEWVLSSFRPEDLDLVVLIDCTAPFISDFLAAFRDAGVPILVSKAFGGQPAGRDTGASFSSRSFVGNSYVRDLLGGDFYFGQAGIPFQPHETERFAQLARFGIEIELPPAQALAPTKGSRGPDRWWAYDAQDTAASEHVVPPGLSQSGRPSWESLSSAVLTRPGRDVVIEPDLWESLPEAERLGLEYALFESRAALRFAGDLDRPLQPVSSGLVDRLELNARYAQLCASVGRRLGRPAEHLRVLVALNSELFSGSEVCGLMHARALADVGARVTVVYPERSVYGADTDPTPLNQWLAEAGLSPARPAPYLTGCGYKSRDPTGVSEAIAQASAFLNQEDPHLVLASGLMPLFTEIGRRDWLLAMCLFQPSAYHPEQLTDMYGRVDALISDCEWSLRSLAPLIGGASRVVHSTVNPSAVNAKRNKQGKVRIAIGGTLQPRKRQLEAIEAVARIAGSHQVELNVYGYELDMMRSYVQELGRAVERHGLTDVVRRHGLVPMDQIVLENDVILSASIDESLPQTLLELMRRGLIGVAVLSGGIDEVVAHGQTGYLTRDASAKGIADVLEAAIADRAHWSDVAVRARARVDDLCGPHVTSRDLFAVLTAAARLPRSRTR